MADHFRFYHYDPSMVAAIIFIVLFILTTGLHTYQLARTRTWYLIPLAIGGYFEWIGYIGRAMSAQETPDWTLGPSIMQSLLILLAPALFAASIYMELGRIILLTEGEHLSLIKRKRLTKIFVCGDVLSFLVQGAGGGILSGKKKSSQSLGSKVIVVGLIIQLAFFGVFIVVTALFDRAVKRKPTAHTQTASSPWHKHLVALYSASALVFVRSVFRIIEYLQGNDGYLLGHEVFLYIFDATLMFVVMVLFNVVHPSEIKAWLRGGSFVRNGIKVVELKSDSNLYQMA